MNLVYTIKVAIGPAGFDTHLQVALRLTRHAGQPCKQQRLQAPGRAEGGQRWCWGRIGSRPLQERLLQVVPAPPAEFAKRTDHPSAPLRFHHNQGRLQLPSTDRLPLLLLLLPQGSRVAAVKPVPICECVRVRVCVCVCVCCVWPLRHCW